MVSAEVEADYMWGLLHPSLLTGEGGYYLTTLSSAVHVLKSLRPAPLSPPLPATPMSTTSSSATTTGTTVGSGTDPTVLSRNMSNGDCKCPKVCGPEFAFHNFSFWGLYCLSLSFLEGGLSVVNDIV